VEVAHGDDKDPEDKDCVKVVDSHEHVDCQEVDSERAVHPLAVPTTVPVCPSHHERPEGDGSLEEADCNVGYLGEVAALHQDALAIADIVELREEGRNNLPSHHMAVDDVGDAKAEAADFSMPA
jgi:hypothetical protein